MHKIMKRNFMSGFDFACFSKVFCTTLLIISLILLCNIKREFIQNDFKRDFLMETIEQNPESIDITERVYDTVSEDDSPFSLHAASACLIDASSHRVLYDKSCDKPLPMASTTKIMTCILALEYNHPEDSVEVSAYAARMPKVKLGMSKGEHYRLNDLLYSLMLESHNDTAVAIAEHIGGSVEGFSDLMNKKAAMLGLSSTHFVTPNGLDAKDHHTTAKELSLIAAYCINESPAKDLFREIISTPTYSFSEESGRRSFTVNNKDLFLTQYEGALGIKTGFTGKAGYCFVGGATRNDMTLISAVLASGWPPDKAFKWQDTKALMDYGFKAYSVKELSKYFPDYKPIPLCSGGSYCASGIKALPVDKTRIFDGPVNYPLKKNDRLIIKNQFPDHINLPVNKGDPIACISIILNDETIYEKTITSQFSVAKYNYHDIIKFVLEYFLI